MRRLAAPLLTALALACAPAAAHAAVPAKLTYVTGLTTAHPRVHVANADGSGAIAIGAGVEALISPDGATVAIVTPYGRHGTTLVVRPAAGGAARTLARAGSIGQLAWSPDGARLAFVAGVKRLVVVDLASGARHVLARGNVQGASFSPDGMRIAYARSRSQRLSAPVNVFVARADGSGGRRAVTHDGRSLYPLWGPRRIAFTHERLRRLDAPVYQLRLMRPNGRGVRQLTHMRIPRLVSGLTATAWSADGRRLLAEYGGQDTSEAWTVDVRSGRARDLTGRFDGTIGRGLSPDGSTVLVQLGYFDNPRPKVATVPFRGGRPTIVVRRAGAPSWGG